MIGIAAVTRAALLIARRASTWTIDEHLGGRSPECVAVDLRSPSAYGPRRAEAYVYRKTGLNRWEQAMSGLPEAKGTTVSQFATHAGEPGVIYAANNHGLFRSDDAGRSWKALDIPWPEPGLEGGVEALACLPE
jgi:hypothetical protein